MGGIRTRNRNRTARWSNDEYIVINGIKMVYTFIAGVCYVHFPGAPHRNSPLAKPLFMLKRQRYHIVEPVRWRRRVMKDCA